MESHGYQKIRSIGEGGFGTAVLCQNKSGEQCVVKEINMAAMDRSRREACINEIKVLRTVNHPNIVKYIDHFTTGTSLFIVMEHAECGDMAHLIKHHRGGFPEDFVVHYFVQICLALKHLHDMNILHRDLKSENVFLSQHRKLVKLGDFGRSAILRDAQAMAKTQCGTAFFWSPEEAAGKPYNAKSDVWALGCLMYEMCTAKMPFDAPTIPQLQQLIIRGEFAPLPSTFSKDMHGLLTALMQHEPERRPSVDEILKMPFIRSKIASICGHYQRRHPEVKLEPAAVADVVERRVDDEGKPLPKPEDFGHQPRGAGDANGQRRHRQHRGHGGRGGGMGGPGMGGMGGPGMGGPGMGGMPGGMGGMGGHMGTPGGAGMGGMPGGRPGAGVPGQGGAVLGIPLAMGGAPGGMGGPGMGGMGGPGMGGMGGPGMGGGMGGAQRPSGRRHGSGRPGPNGPPPQGGACGPNGCPPRPGAGPMGGIAGPQGGMCGPQGCPMPQQGTPAGGMCGPQGCPMPQHGVPNGGRSGPNGPPRTGGHGHGHGHGHRHGKGYEGERRGPSNAPKGPHRQAPPRPAGPSSPGKPTGAAPEFNANALDAEYEHMVTKMQELLRQP